ncbi:ammonium transporter [Thermomonospora curvata]|uniref:Ammonium transporter n=1 Tax=Thermomonospora curvata (strain ATCC 19995 / DSM 43183 / JCM 3096 / KCTC 9072 / NBRC 15933 / NCIMB 10081 / Henssen B9) TaxID=471852 RepID=D1AEP9_THECD|nr:ammonium transporter [Thermomonospora curvata]ACY97624.1 ammonium transporter [Thermomonospora curvata DSM 43183]
MEETLNTGDSAWVLVSFAMVLLMTPGLALFYGGMVRAKNLVSVLYMSFVSIAVVTVIWFVYGFGLAFGEDVGGLGLIGWGQWEFFRTTPSVMREVIPVYVFSLFQLVFAIITLALISGSVANRVRLGPWMIFGVIWVTLVYLPVAHWVFSKGGWLNRWGVLDFAGGLVVELNSGIAGLALALALGPGLSFRREEPPRPKNIPLVMTGMGLLWFGWFGFNGGSALTDGALAANAVVNTMMCGCVAMLVWMLLERARFGHFSRLGGTTGALAGLVAITPACGYVNLFGATAIGIVAAVVCTYAVEIKTTVGYDDTLDVAGIHGVGGIVGVTLLGLLATGKYGSATAGLVFGGSIALLGKQLVAILAVGAYSFVLTYLIGKVVDKLFNLRPGPREEALGLDTELRIG